MHRPDLPAVLSIAGRKNSGKTTLTVALAAELSRRGYRVASMKHGHHAFDIDHPGRDSWRHYHEGGVEAVLIASAGKVALVRRAETEADPVELIGELLAGRGYDVVLVEGYRHGPFPKVEIFRKEQKDAPVYDPGDAPAAALFLAMVTDDPEMSAPFPVIPLDPADPAGAHVHRLADLLVASLLRPAADA